MIDVDFEHGIYTCPYCNAKQAFSNTHAVKQVGYTISHNPVPRYDSATALSVYHILCTNQTCRRVTAVGLTFDAKMQIDLFPQHVHRHFPDYVPEQIRQDYEEASSILALSPKASATLLRRCLQGMIHDFWGIHEKNLNAEITTLKAKSISSSQWAAIDSLRQLGNIGAHMERDVNTIIDIDEGEAQKLMKLIELLIEKWYIARHDEEALFAEITDMADEKQVQRKGGV